MRTADFEQRSNNLIVALACAITVLPATAVAQSATIDLTAPRTPDAAVFGRALRRDCAP